MTDAAVPTDPLLSPMFEKARRLSRVLAALFAVGWWVTVVWLALGTMVVVAPQHGGLSLGHPLRLEDLPLGRRADVFLVIVLTTMPSLAALRFARRMFLQFATGQVFAASTIASIRATALWLIAVPFAAFLQEVLINILIPAHPADVNPTPSLLFVGIGTYVAAYVMAEARRIADENAGFV